MHPSYGRLILGKRLHVVCEYPQTTVFLKTIFPHSLVLMWCFPKEFFIRILPFFEDFITFLLGLISRPNISNSITLITLTTYLGQLEHKGALPWELFKDLGSRSQNNESVDFPPFLSPKHSFPDRIFSSIELSNIFIYTSSLHLCNMEIGFTIFLLNRLICRYTIHLVSFISNLLSSC